MTRYKKDAKEFDVSVTSTRNRDGSESLICRIPKPVVQKLGDPERIKFVIDGRTIVVKTGGGIKNVRKR